jgi:hypothetical protein
LALAEADMRFVIIAIGPLILAVVIILFSACSRSKSPAANVRQAKTLENKLDALKECGLQLASPFTRNDLLKSWQREDYEKDGFDLVLVGLGMTEEKEPWRNHSVNVWHFDTESIEDNGDYKRIAERMVEMSQGSLPLENIEDHVDIEKGQAWLSFTFEGKSIKVDCAVKDDWVDPAIFGRFVDLLTQSDPSKIFIYYVLGGQDCIISCVTKNNFECLKSQGLNFVALK